MSTQRPSLFLTSGRHYLRFCLEDTDLGQITPVITVETNEGKSTEIYLVGVAKGDQVGAKACISQLNDIITALQKAVVFMSDRSFEKKEQA